jgi:hypothetical protein
MQLVRAAKQVLPRGAPLTVPQVWLGGSNFGDSEAVVRAHAAGKLERYRAAA